MGENINHRNYLSVTNIILLVGVSITLVIPSCTYSTSSKNTFSGSRNYYQTPPQYYSFANVSGAAFEARDGSSGYSVPVAGSSYGSSGDYGASAVPLPIVYKYAIQPTMQKQSNGWGWSGGNNDDGDDAEFPTELIGLLGLKGLKGLKGLVGLLGLLKALLALKKLLLLPLLLLLLPILLPLFLLKLALILFLPVPVLSTTAGRDLQESATWISFRNDLQEKLDSLMTKLPQDIGDFIRKIKEPNGKISWRDLLSEQFENMKINKNKANQVAPEILADNKSAKISKS